MKSLVGGSFWKETLHFGKSDNLFISALHAHTHTSDLHSNQTEKQEIYKNRPLGILHFACWAFLWVVSKKINFVHIEPVCTTSPLVFNIKIIVFIHILTDEQMLLSHYAKLTAVNSFKTKSLNENVTSSQRWDFLSPPTHILSDLTNNAALSLGSEIKRSSWGSHLHTHVHSVVHIQWHYSNIWRQKLC